MRRVVFYLKKHYKAILFLAAFFCLIFLLNGRSYPIFYFALFLLAQVEARYRDKRDESRERALKAKGLERIDLANISFVKAWEETRTAGLWRYCFIDGGLIMGAGIAFALCLIIPGIIGTTTVFSGPGMMFTIIGYSYLIGIMIGTISFRIIWPYRERKFKRLTTFPFGLDKGSKEAINNFH